MDVADPFSPGYSNGHVETFDDWNAPPTQEGETESKTWSASPSGEAEEAETHDRVQARSDGGLEEAQRLAAQLAAAADGLSRALRDAESEREAGQSERGNLQSEVARLEKEAARKEEFRSVFFDGSGSALTLPELKSLQDVTDALAADPDRLTTLFAVVQQSERIATLVRVFTELRQLAEEE